jgi:hypothetical protein
VVFGDRDVDDFQDVWRCVDASTGKELWQIQYFAIGQLDYGNSPRATPLIVNDLVILAGALGDVCCAELATGKIIWQLNLKAKFGAAADLPWGFCASPLLVDDKLILVAGTEDALLLALNPRSGELVWKGAGGKPAYGSLIETTLGNRRQIVGFDAEALRGWDVESGQLLWSLKPEHPGDFHVPTPLVFDGKLIVMSEGNGTRMHRFEENGMIDPQPVASNHRLSPDMSSPVRVGDQLLCVNGLLTGLSLTDGLKLTARHRDVACAEYGSIVTDGERALAFGKGELLLLVVGEKVEVAGRCRLFAENAVIYAHPAMVGDRLYVRGESSLKCIQLGALSD